MRRKLITDELINFQLAAKVLNDSPFELDISAKAILINEMSSREAFDPKKPQNLVNLAQSIGELYQTP